MEEINQPTITEYDGESKTKVIFKPDLETFHMESLDGDIIPLVRKRVRDIAVFLGEDVTVKMNRQRVKVETFSEYAHAYIRSAFKKSKHPRPICWPANYALDSRWEVCVTASKGTFQQMSYVNGIATLKGGTHVEHVTKKITNHLINVVKKKVKNSDIQVHEVMRHLWVFVNARIDNPVFCSQSRKTLTLPESSFSHPCELSQSFLNKVANSKKIMDNLLKLDNLIMVSI